jgi:hypothetical protein
MADRLRLQLLGRFEVWRGTDLIPPGEWRGQKPRDLLKLPSGTVALHVDTGRRIKGRRSSGPDRVA